MDQRPRAKGTVDGKMIRLVCAFEKDTWERIAGLAVEYDTSLAEQIRRLVDTGLDEMDSDPRP
jgi:hypothetical protein